jgi:hypothetical protein
MLAFLILRANDHADRALPPMTVAEKGAEKAQYALSKREDSSTLMISTTVANAIALLKSHLPDFDVELLRKDFAVDEAKHEALTNGAYHATHEFASSYDFSSLVESAVNDSHRNL